MRLTVWPNDSLSTDWCYIFRTFKPNWSGRVVAFQTWKIQNGSTFIVFSGSGSGSRNRMLVGSNGGLCHHLRTTAPGSLQSAISQSSSWARRSWWFLKTRSFLILPFTMVPISTNAFIAQHYTQMYLSVYITWTLHTLSYFVLNLWYKIKENWGMSHPGE